MSDFAKVMVVSLVLLALATLVFGNINFTGSGLSGSGGFEFVPAGEGGDGVRSSSLSTTKSSFFVGTQDSADFTTKDIRRQETEISYLTGIEVLASGNVDVRRGNIQRQFEVMTFDLSDEEIGNIAELVITGTVTNTNRYGNLRFWLNGKRIFSDAPVLGETFFENVDSSLLENKNEFIIGTEASGWRVWAPTVYQTSFVLRSGVSGNTSQSFSFAVGSDEIPVNNGRVTFRPINSKGTGVMNIFINSREVYNSTPELGKTNIVDFDGGLLDAGKNTVSFGATGNAIHTIDDINVIYFFDVSTQNPVTRLFDLDEDDIDNLPGKIRFSITDVVDDPSELQISVVSKSGRTERKLEISNIRERTYTIDIEEDDVKEGRNKAIFRLIGNGGVQISNFEVDI